MGSEAWNRVIGPQAPCLVQGTTKRRTTPASTDIQYLPESSALGSYSPELPVQGSEVNAAFQSWCP